MKAFLTMGGYAQFVWPAFALTFVVLVWNLLRARRQYEAALGRINRRRSSADAEFDT